jgi:galactokinase
MSLLASRSKTNSEVCMTARVDLLNLTARFREAYGVVPRIFVGPGRINIIGEHVDYCGGMVMPAAIDRACYVAVAHNGTNNLRVSSDFGEATIALDKFEAKGDWRDYVAGMAFALIEAGEICSGYDLMIASDVPIGAGVSSSAALEVALGLAMTGGDLTGARLAQIAQRAENHFVGMNCGIMDQFASANGVADHALMLDCESLAYTPLAIPTDVRFLLIDSGVKHAHVGGGYTSRREDCEAAAKTLGVGLLCEIEDPAHLENLDGNPRKRARHVVSEIARTKAAQQALDAGDIAKLGDLINQSHASLSHDMEVSTPEVDRLAAIAQATNGVYGARMMGGGFGGSVIALVDAAQVEAAQASIVASYGDYLGRAPDAFIARLAQGGHELKVYT